MIDHNKYWGRRMDYENVFTEIQGEREYLVDVLRQLIRVDTSLPPGLNYHKVIDVLEPGLREYGFDVSRVPLPEEKLALLPSGFEGDRPNLVATMDNDKAPLSIYAHMDVVPADDSWSMPPFGGEIRDGCIYGRGAVDDKGPMACLLTAVKVMHKLGLESKYDLSCLFCTDEEADGYAGSRYLAEERYFSDHILWMDLGGQMPIFIAGAAGTLSVELIGVGKSCHSGMNFLGINAVEEMVPILNELMILKQEVEQRESTIASFPDPQNPYEYMTPMFNLAIIHGGTKDNIVPGECRLTINRRYIREESADQAIREITEAVERGAARSKLLDVKLKVHKGYGPVAIDTGSVEHERWENTMKVVCGFDELIYGGIGGSTDLCHVYEAKPGRELSVITAGVGRMGSNVHGADEHVHIEDLITFTKQLLHYFTS
jgi:succinyl-diaminopimelate desuccinylase